MALKSITGSGGFYLPKVFYKAQKEVAEKFDKAEIDYANLTKWDFPDELLCFVMEMDLLKFVDETYPNPRAKNEVPIWFLITCQFVLRLHQSGKYADLRFLLNSGSLLTKFGFNIGAKKIGFNDKNQKERKTVADPDTVRKFFKDTNPKEICQWYRDDLQYWFKSKRAFDHKGLFVLDQSHLVVPNNPNYKDAVRMPVDEHGQLYSGLKDLTQEQKQALVYHPCYTLSTLLNVGFDKSTFHIAGYELGPGNEDELVQAEKIVFNFCKEHPGVMKELIVDRGYISGEFIGKLKEWYGVDTIVPLKTNMDTYKEAKEAAIKKDNWTLVEEEVKDGRTVLKIEAQQIHDIDLWENLPCKQQTVVSRYTRRDPLTYDYVVSYGVLVSTKQFTDPKTVISRYGLRIQIEECFRQFKNDWDISDFPSPNASLIESHVCFTLLTYSLIQFYLRRNDLQEKTRCMMTTLRNDEQLGKDAVVVYTGNQYGVFDLDDYTARVAGMADAPRAKLKALMESQKEARIKREKS